MRSERAVTETSVGGVEVQALGAFHNSLEIDLLCSSHFKQHDKHRIMHVHVKGIFAFLGDYLIIYVSMFCNCMASIICPIKFLR